MNNDLLGPKALNHVYDVLGLNTDIDFTCEELASSVDCQVFDDFEEKIIELDLPGNVRLVKMAYESNGTKYHEFGIVDFKMMDLKR